MKNICHGGRNIMAADTQLLQGELTSDDAEAKDVEGLLLGFVEALVKEKNFENGQTSQIQNESRLYQEARLSV
jgi:hypothetical protein